MPVYGTLARRPLIDLLGGERAYATTLLILLIDEFGTEFFDWEPATLRLEIEETYGVRPSSISLDRIWAGVTLLTTDQLYRTAESFNAIANALNGDDASFAVFDPVDTAEAAWCVTEARLLLGADYDPKMFTPEVRAYVGAIMAQDDIRRGVTPLEFAIFEDRQPAVDATFAEALLRREGDSLADMRSYVTARTRELLTQLNDLPLCNSDQKWPEILHRLVQATSAT